MGRSWIRRAQLCPLLGRRTSGLEARQQISTPYLNKLLQYLWRALLRIGFFCILLKIVGIFHIGQGGVLRVFIIDGRHVGMGKHILSNLVVARDCGYLPLVFVIIRHKLNHCLAVVSLWYTRP